MAKRSSKNVRNFILMVLILVAGYFLFAWFGGEADQDIVINDYYSEIEDIDDAYPLGAAFFLGYSQDYYDEAILTDVLESYLPDLAVLDIEVFQESGDEWYLIVPKYEGTVISVATLDFDDTMNQVAGEEIYSTEAPFIIQCNPSDLFASIECTLTFQDEEISFSPRISLENGEILQYTNIFTINDVK